jgi:hypothetical protein
VHRYLDIPLDERLAWLDNIPQIIRDVPQWLNFKLEKDAKGKYDKVPYYVDGGKRYGTQGDPEDRERLTNFNRALARVRDGRAHGVGFAPLPGGPVSIIDFDGSDSAARHARILARTWSETSVGGAGAHALVLGDMGTNRKDRKKHVEIFSTKGFVALTGEPIIDECGTIHGRRIAKSLINGTPYEPQQKTSPLSATFYNEHERAKIIDAFKVLRCRKVDYEQWIKVGQALHSADSDPSGPTFKLWLRWSRGDPERFKGEDDLAYHWRSFRGSGITLATLYGYAKELRPKRERVQFDNPGELIEDLEKINYGKPRIFIEGLLAEGLTLLTGQKKLARKTFFVLQCAAMSSLGEAFLGATPMQPLRCVAYMLEEGGVVRDEDGKDAVPADVVIERLKSMSLLNDAKRGKVRFKWELEPLQDGGFEQIEADAEHSDVIFIDSRQMVFNEDAEKVRNVWSKDYQQLLPLREIARKHHCAIVVVNHASKGSDARDAIDASAATGGIDAAVDGMLVMQNPNKDDPTRIRMTIHHRRMKNAEIELRWDPQTCRFEKVGPWLGTGKLVEILTAIVRATERGQVPSTIQITRSIYPRNADQNKANVSRMLTQLRRDGMVTFVEDFSDARIKLWRATPAALARFVD